MAFNFTYMASGNIKNNTKIQFKGDKIGACN